MLLLFQTLLASLLVLHVNSQFNVNQSQFDGCDALEFGGKTTLQVAGKLRENLMNMLVFLENNDMSDLPVQAEKYFTHLKEDVKDNSIDVFRLIRSLKTIHDARTPVQKCLLTLEQLETVALNKNCQWKCSIAKWKNNNVLTKLFNQIPENLILDGIHLKNREDLDYVSEVGEKLRWPMGPTNENERDIEKVLGTSILNVLREIQTKKVCFNEEFFGYLLPFYPWPTSDVEVQMAVHSLKRFFVERENAFVECNVYLQELYTMIDQPVMILDLILNQMDTSRCAGNMNRYVRKLLAVRQNNFQESNVNSLIGLNSVINLLTVINSDAYPVEIVLARDRVHNYLIKVMPFLDQEEFVSYIYETPQNMLMAFLNFVIQDRPHPIPDVRDAIRSIISHLFFQSGAKRISAETLDFILDAWSAPDLLKETRVWAQQAKVILQKNYRNVEQALSQQRLETCVGILSCYGKIIRVLEEDERCKFMVDHLRNPPCLNGNGRIPSTNATSLVELLDTINHQKYPQAVVSAAFNLKNYLLKTHSVIVAINPKGCTRDEVLLDTLEANTLQGDFRVIENAKSISTAIRNKIDSLESETHTLDVSPQIYEFNVAPLTVTTFLRIISRLQGQKQFAKELEVAKMYVQEHENTTNVVLTQADCRDSVNVADCFRNILSILEAQPPDESSINNYVMSFLLRPTWCDHRECWWVPYEEQESGPLNPVLAYQVYALDRLAASVPLFNVKLAVKELIKVVQKEDVKCALDGLKFDSTTKGNVMLLQFLSVLKECRKWDKSLENGFSKTIKFASMGMTSTTLNVHSLSRLAHMLIERVKSAQIAQSMMENVQLLFKDVDQTQEVLDMLPIDCMSMESCISSLIKVAQYDRQGTIINTIANIIHPKQCTKVICPWLISEVVPSALLNKLLNALTAITNDNKTPLSIVFVVDHLRKFLQSPQAQPFLTKIEPIVVATKDALQSTLQHMVQDQTLPSNVREDAQKAWNFLRNSLHPNSFSVSDLIRLLMLVEERTSSVSIKNKIKVVLSQIRENVSIFNSIVSMFHVQCNNLNSCLNNLHDTVLDAAKRHPVMIPLLELLKLLVSSIDVNQNTSVVLDNVVENVTRMIRDPNTPFHVQMDLKQVLNVLRSENLAPIITNVLQSLPRNVLLEILRSLPFDVKRRYDVVENVRNIIDYMTNGILPKNLNENTLAIFATSLAERATNPLVVNEITSYVNRLQMLPETAKVVALLPVNCERLQQCVDSLTRSIRQTFYQSEVTQIIDNILMPSTCTIATCGWIRPVINPMLLHRVSKQRAELIRYTQHDRVPLIIKIYGTILLEYFTSDVISKFPEGNSLAEDLDNIVERDRFPRKVSDAALNVLKYIDRNVIPVTLTHRDLLGIAEQMIISTPDKNVVDEVKKNTYKLLHYPTEVDNLLSICQIKCDRLEPCVARLVECVKTHAKNLASSAILRYLIPSSCTKQTCTWIITTESPTLPILALTNNSLYELKYLMKKPGVPFIIQLNLKHLERLIKSQEFQQLVQSTNATVTLETVFEFRLRMMEFTLQMQLPKNLTMSEFSDLATLLKKTPLSVVTRLEYFDSVKNVIQYFSSNQVPTYLDATTAQMLAKILANRARELTVTIDLNQKTEALLKLPYIAQWLSVLPVTCDTFPNCIRSFTKSLTTVMIPDYIFQDLYGILRPSNCIRSTCDWITDDSSYEVVTVISEARNQLVRISQSRDAPLIIQLAADQVLRYFTVETLNQYVVTGARTLEHLLSEMTNKSTTYPQDIREKANVILNYLRNRVTASLRLTPNDLILIVQKILKDTNNMFIQQEIATQANILFRHRNQYHTFLSRCLVNCTYLYSCVAQLESCARNWNDTTAKILNDLFNPPECTPRVCKWRPTDPQMPPPPTLPLINVFNLLVFVPLPDGHYKFVMLNLNDAYVVQTLEGLTKVADVNKKPITAIVRNDFGEPIHLQLDFTDSRVQQTILGLYNGSRPYLDFTTMTKISIVFPFSDGHIRALTFDLTDERVRTTLIKLARRPPVLGKPTIEIRDLDGSLSLLCVDETDQLLMMELLDMSIDDKTKTNKPLLIVWPSTTGVWSSVNIQKLTKEDLVYIQNLPNTYIIGYPTQLLVTSVGVVPISFDVHDYYVTHVLDSIGKSHIPTIKTSEDDVVGLTVPDKYGRMTILYLDMTDEVIDQLKVFSINQTDCKRSTFILIENNTSTWICLNLDNPLVVDFIHHYLEQNRRPGVGPDSKVINKMLETVTKGLQVLIDSQNLPFNIKLDVKAVQNFLQTKAKVLSSIILTLPQNKVDILQNITNNIVSQMLNADGIITIDGRLPVITFLEQLSEVELAKFSVVTNVWNILNYFRFGKSPTIMNENSLSQLVKILANSVDNQSVIIEMQQLSETIPQIPGVNDILNQLPLYCNTLQSCIASIIDALKSVPKNSPLYDCLEKLIKYIGGKQPTKESPFFNLLEEALNVVNVMLNNDNIPFHIRLDMNEISRLLREDKVRDRLAVLMESLPPNILESILTNSQKLLDKIKAESMVSPAEIISTTLKFLPFTLLTEYKITDNVNNIIKYFENGVLPDNLNVNTVQKLAYILSSNTSSRNVAIYIRKEAEAVTSMAKLQDWLPQLPVDCESFQTCVESLMTALQNVPLEDDVIVLLKNILSPPGCTTETCPWIQNIPGVQKEAPIMDLLNVTITKLCAMKDQLDIPLHVRLDIYALCKIRDPKIWETLWEMLKSLPDSELEEMAQNALDLLNRFNSTTPPSIVELIQTSIEIFPNSFAQEQNIWENARNVKNYFQYGVLPIVLNQNSLSNLVEIVLKDMDDQNIVTRLEEKMQTVLHKPNIQDMLAQLPVKCISMEICLDTLKESVWLSPQQDETALILLDVLNTSIDIVKGKSSTDGGNRPKIVVLPTNNGKGYVVLDLNDPEVQYVLEQLTEKLNPKYPTIVMDVITQDGRKIPVKLNLNDQTTVLTLMHLQDRTLKTFEPIRVQNQFGSFIIGVVPGVGGQVVPFVISDDKKTYQQFAAQSQEQGLSTITLPFSEGTVYVSRRAIKPTDTLPLPDLTYLPPDCHLQPDSITLPDNVVVTVDWNKIPHEKLRLDVPGVLIPIVQADCSVSFITVDLRNETIILLLKSQSHHEVVRPNDNSIVVVPVRNDDGTVTHIVLDLSREEVLKALIEMSKRVDPRSNNLVTINYVQSDGTVVPITFDMNHLNRNILEKLDQMNSVEMGPIHIKQNNSDLLVLIVQTPTGDRQNVVLNVSDDAAIEALKNMSDVRNPNAIVIDITDSSGKPIRIYIDKKDEKIVRHLIEMGQSDVITDKPIVNVKPCNQSDIYVVIEDPQHGRIIIKLNGSDPDVHKKLKDILEGGSGKGTTILVPKEDGSVDYINVDTSNGKVVKILQDMADQVTVIPPDHSMIVIQLPDGIISVIDTSNPDVIKTLLNMTSEVDVGQGDLAVVTVVDSFGDYHNVILNMNDPNTVAIIKNLGNQTTPNVEPIQIPGQNEGSIVTVITTTDESGNTVSLLIDGSDDVVMKKLQRKSNMLDPNAVKVCVTDSNNNVIELYLNLKDPEVIRILREANAKPSTTLPLISVTGEESVETSVAIPVVKKGQQEMLKCNLTNEYVKNVLIKLSQGKSSAHPIYYDFIVTDWTGRRRLIRLDTARPDVLRELSAVCSPPPKDKDMLLITIRDSSGLTHTYVLNTNNLLVLKKLKELSNMTVSKEKDDMNVTVIQVTDVDGKVLSLSLDLTDPYVQKVLQELHYVSSEDAPSHTILVDENGSKTLLVVKVKDSEGRVNTLVIDVSDENTIRVLVNNSDSNNPNAMPIVVNTSEGRKVLYLDYRDPYLIKIMVKLSEKRKPNKPVIIQPTYEQTTAVSLSFFIDGHTIQLTFNLSKPEVRNIIKTYNTTKSENTRVIVITENDGRTTSYHIDITDSKVMNELKKFSDKYQVFVNDGSLAIIPIVAEDNRLEYMLLDTSNDAVVKELTTISDGLVDHKNATVFNYIDKNGKTGLCRIVLDDETIRKILRKLQQLTPPDLKPMTILNPYAPNPFIVTTVKDERGVVRPIVLDTNDENLINQLKQLQRPNPKRPLTINYPNNKGGYDTIVLDLADPHVFKTLMEVSRPNVNYPFEVMSNVPSVGTDVSTSLVIAAENEKQQVEFYTFDTSNIDVFNGLLSLASPQDVASTVIYVQNPYGGISAIRIDTKNNDVVTTLKELSDSSKVKVDPKSLVTFVVSEVGGHGTYTIMLDVSNGEVVDALKKMSSVPSNSEDTVVISVTDANGHPVPITIDLRNPRQREKIKRLQQKTPPNMLPVIVPNPTGPKPFIIFTLKDDDGSVQSIVLDTNNVDVVEELKRISRPNDRDSFAVQVVDGANKRQVLYINPSISYVKTKLLKLSKWCPILPGPIVTFDPKQLIAVPVVDTDGKLLEIVLDPRDPVTVTAINNLTRNQINRPPGPSITINVPDSTGTNKPIKLSKNDYRVINTLIRMARRVVVPTAPKVVPPTGPLALIPLCVITPEAVKVFTLDPNNQMVMENLMKLNDPDATKFDIVRLIVPTWSGKEVTVNLDAWNANVIDSLEQISNTASVWVYPIKVIPSQHKRPLLSLIIPEQNQLTAVTLDLENDNTLDELRYFDIGQTSNTITLEFDTPRAGKTVISLDVKDAQIVEKMKQMSKTLPVKIIPVHDRFPVISVTLKNGEVIQIDTGNPEIVNQLNELSKLPDNDYYPTIEIVLKTQEGINNPVKIGLNNPRILEILRKINKKTALPIVRVIGPHNASTVNVATVTILPPNHRVYPLVSILVPNVGQITLDPNNYQVMSKLVQLGRNVVRDQATVLFVSDTDGNVLKLPLDLNNPRVIAELKKLADLCPIKIEPRPRNLPTLVVNITDTSGVKRPVRLELEHPTILNTLLELDKFQYKNPYRIQLPIKGASRVLWIDFDDKRVIDRINELQTGNSIPKPHFVILNVPDTFGNTWEIVIDTENAEVMRRITDRSNKTPPNGATTLQIVDKSGKQINLKLNLFDVSTINLLKELTVMSTGRPAKMTKKPPKMVGFTIQKPNGEAIVIKIDLNNNSVMKKLKQLSDMFKGLVKAKVDLKLEDGRVLTVEFDPTDPATIQNLINLQRESMGGPPKPLLPVGDKQSIQQKMLITFKITSPHYGEVTVTLDLYKPGMMDKLEALNRAFQEGRPQTLVLIDNQRGRTLRLRLDVTNQKIVEALGDLTEESIGKNPIANKVAEEVFVPELVTMEVPVGLEKIYISLNKMEDAVKKKLLELNKPRTGQSTTIDIEVNRQPMKVALDTTDRKVLSALQSVSVPTAYPGLAPQVSLITLIFLPNIHGYMPLEIDLSHKQHVMNIISISRKYQANMRAPSYVEVRDDTGQYLRVPLDLNDPNVIAELNALYQPKQRVEIDARRMPYMTLVMPGAGEGPFNVVKVQLKPKNLEKLETLPSYDNGTACRLQIVDALNVQHTINLPVGSSHFVDAVASLEEAVVLGPVYANTLFIIYAVDENGANDPTYLNMGEQRTESAVRQLRYDPNRPLTVIQYIDRGGRYEYVYLDITNPMVTRSLSEYNYAVGTHSIVRQMLQHKVILTIPAGDGGSLKITLDLANQHVLRELKDITKAYEHVQSTTVVKLEDAYGFPLILKFDYNDRSTVERLKALSDSTSIVNQQ